jgi:hypothetical protein
LKLCNLNRFKPLLIKLLYEFEILVRYGTIL